jgi:Kef-type K+ transport system membrane component KefB
MQNEISIILILSAIIFISPLLSKISKIPTIPIEIILGSFVISFGLIVPNHIFTLVAELGFLYLMFLAGLEVDLKSLLKVDIKVIKKALIYMLILYTLTSVFTIYFELSNVLIVTMPLISIGLLAALKKEYGDTVWINFAITIGIIGEVISIIALTVVSAKLEYGLGVEFYSTLGLLFIVFLSTFIIYKILNNLIWWFPGIKIYLMPQSDTQEQDIRVSMAIFFLFIAIMLYLHLEVALGAFVAGVFINTFFHHNTELPKKLEHFGFGWLVPIFFVWVGTTFDLEALLKPNLVYIALSITFAMIILRIIASMLFLNELKAKGVFLFALSHSMPLTLIVAVATLALNANAITNYYYYVFILSAILEVIISMILIKIINNFVKMRFNS